MAATFMMPHNIFLHTLVRDHCCASPRPLQLALWEGSVCACVCVSVCVCVFWGRFTLKLNRLCAGRLVSTEIICKEILTH